MTAPHRATGVALVFVLAACPGADVAAPMLVATSAQIDFGQVQIDSSRRVELMIQNVGSVPVRLNGWRIDGALFGEVRVEGFPAELPAGATRPLEVIFTPRTSGARSGSLEIDGEGADLSIPMFADASQDPLQLTPSFIDFGRVAIGETGFATVRLRNVSSRVITVRSIGPDRQTSPDFQLRVGSIVSLHPGDSQEILAEFAPTQTGLQTGRFIVADNAGLSITRGWAVQGEGFRLGIDVTPPRVDFVSIAVNSVAERQLRLRNLGTEARTITRAEFVGSSTSAYAFELSNFPVELTPGSVRDVRLTFRPQVELTSAGALRLWGPGDVLLGEVILTASTLIPPTGALEVVPGSIAFGDVLEARTATRTIRIDNVGFGRLEISRIGVEPNGGAFEVTAEPMSLEPLDSVTLPIRWTATATAPTEGTLVIESDGGVARVPLTADYTTDPVPMLALENTTFDLGAGVVGGTSIRILRVENVGTAPWFADDLDNEEPAIRAFGNIPTEVGPGQTRVFAFEFSATEEFERRRRLEFVGNSELSFVVEGRGVSASPVAVLVGATSQSGLVDLHLIREGGALFDRPDDACWCNPNPDWGIRGRADDDPRLASDGVSRIELGPSVRGTFQVVLHSRDEAVMDVTAQVLVSSSLVATAERAIGPGQRWDVGRLRIGNGAPRFEMFDTSPVVSVRATCY